MQNEELIKNKLKPIFKYPNSQTSIIAGVIEIKPTAIHFVLDTGLR